MVNQIAGGFWYQNHCLKVTPQKKGGSVRYRYPGEEWTLVNADNYKVSDNRYGQCAGAHYMVDGVFSYQDRHGKSYEYKGVIRAFTPPSNFRRILNPSNPWKFLHTFWENESAYSIVYLEYEDTWGNIRIIPKTPPSNRTFGLPGSSSFDGVGFTKIISSKITRVLRAYDYRTVLPPESDNCGNCRLTIFNNGKVVHEEEREECPEVEETGDECVEDESTKVEVRTSPLGQIWISKTAFSRNGGLLGDLPDECVHIYNMVPYIPIGGAPGFGSNGTGSQILAFIGEYCSEKGCDRPTVVRLGDDCKESCPDGTCAVICGDSACCADRQTGRIVQSIPLSEYKGGGS